MRKMMLFAALTTLAGSLTGCSTSQSKDIATDGLYSNNSAIADGSGNTTVTTFLQVGNSLSDDYLELDPGDTLTASAGTVSQKMAPEQDIFGAFSYSTVLAVDSAGTVFKVDFNRAVPQVSAPDSQVTMPDAFAITSQSNANGSYSRATDPIVITWTGSGQTDPMTLSVTGSCITDYFVNPLPADSGTYTINAGTLVTAQGQTGAGATCPISIDMDRNRAGTVDPAFGNGGIFTATQDRTVTTTSKP